jgi:voltage-gated potassium channel
MDFVRETGTAIGLIAFTLFLQCGGMGAVILWNRTHLFKAISRVSGFHSAVLMVRFASVMIGLHVSQILLWAGFYRWKCFPSWEPAFYFSITSFSTVGYGDIVLPRIWRTLGPVESLTGVLMCGLSASLLFAIVHIVVQARIQKLAG